MLLILCYHDVDPTNQRNLVIAPELLGRQIELLRHAGYEIVPLDAIHSPRYAGKNLAVITFDDGRAGCAYHARTVLRQHRCPATFFICPGFINGEAPAQERYTGFMNWQEIQALADDGHIIGAHSMTHRSLDKLTDDEVRYEMRQSAAVINAQIRQIDDNDWTVGCQHFALPYGDGGDREVRIAAEEGYKTCLFTGGQINELNADPMRYQRICMEAARTPLKFLKILGKLPRLQATPEYSFIVPTCDEGPALLATVRNIRSLGDREQVEIIVVDDGNVKVDQSPETELMQLVDGVVVTDRVGIPVARNEGAARATGAVLVFTDSHVCFARDFLLALATSGVAAGCGIRGCKTHMVRNYDDFVLISQDPSRTDDRGDGYYGWMVQTTDEFNTLPVKKILSSRDGWSPVPYVGACALAISANLFHQIGGFDAELYGVGSMEDCELAMRCWALGYDVLTTGLTQCWHYTTLAPREAPAGKQSVYDQLSHQRYPGELRNIVRLLGAYYPNNIAYAIIDTIDEKCRRAGIPSLHDDFLSLRKDVHRQKRSLKLSPMAIAHIMSSVHLTGGDTNASVQ